MNALKKYLRRAILRATAVERGLPVPFVGRNERRRQRATPHFDDDCWYGSRTYRWRSKNLAKVNNRDERRAAL